MHVCEFRVRPRLVCGARVIFSRACSLPKAPFISLSQSDSWLPFNLKHSATRGESQPRKLFPKVQSPAWRVKKKECMDLGRLGFCCAPQNVTRLCQVLRRFDGALVILEPGQEAPDSLCLLRSNRSAASLCHDAHNKSKGGHARHYPSCPVGCFLFSFLWGRGSLNSTKKQKGVFLFFGGAL